MAETDCLFCKIANGEIPSSTVYEDDRFRVILDLSPAARGHALVIPKEHSENIYAIDDDTLKEAIVLAKKVAAAMKESLNCEGLNIIQNNGELAGQTVFHFHIHIIPRYSDDGQNIGWKPGTSDPGEQEKIARQIAAAIR